MHQRTCRSRNPCLPRLLLATVTLKFARCNPKAGLPVLILWSILKKSDSFRHTAPAQYGRKGTLLQAGRWRQARGARQAVLWPEGSAAC